MESHEDHKVYKVGGISVEETSIPQAEPGTHPEPVGTELARRMAGDIQFAGRCKRVALRQGFDLSLYDIEVDRVFIGGGVTVGAHLAVSVLLEAQGEGWLADAEGRRLAPPFLYRPGMTYLAFLKAPAPGYYQLPAGSRFRVVEVRVTLDFLARLATLHHFVAATHAHPLCKRSGDGHWIGLLRTPAAIELPACSILASGFDEGADPLVMEAHALQILARAIDAVKAGGKRGARTAKGRDERKLMEARDLMLADPGRAWTIRTLAQQVGLNDRKLKEGFRRSFADTFHGCLTKARMAAARELLMAGASSVTDVSLRVGYANPSHFALQFRRAFGVAPLQFVRGLDA